MSYIKHTPLISAMSLLVTLALPLHAESAWKVSTGVDYSKGDYGEDVDTEIFYVPVTVRLQTFPWTLKLTVPYLQIEGPSGVVGGIDGGGVIVSETTDTRTDSGLGDIFVTAAYSIDPPTDSAPFIDLQGKIKIPTADEDQALGTGEFDYTALVELGWSLDQTFVFVSGGYQILGDPSGSDLNNRFLFSIGADWTLSDPLHAGLFLDWKQASTDSSDDPLEAMGYLNYKLSPDTSLNVYTYTGFSDGSPDIGGGFQLSQKL